MDNVLIWDVPMEERMNQQVTEKIKEQKLGGGE